jgi:COMPASS component SPP1
MALVAESCILLHSCHIPTSTDQGARWDLQHLYVGFINNLLYIGFGSLSSPCYKLLLFLCQVTEKSGWTNANIDCATTYQHLEAHLGSRTMDQSPFTTETMESGIQPPPVPIDEPAKLEAMVESSFHSTSEVPQQNSSTKPPPHPPLSSTEPPNMTVQPVPTTKKKGTASTVKRAPKRPKNGPSRPNKKPKTEIGNDGLITEDALASEDGEEEGEGDEESDHGPYCICRGPDDHRWMINCDNCQEWFHGECINLDQEIGDMAETFICPSCTDRNIFTLYQKTCALSGCRKASRLNEPEKSVFCSQEHAHTYWERLVSRLPRSRGKSGLSDHLKQEEFMALLGGGLAETDDEGLWSLARTPFSNTSTKGVAGMLNPVYCCVSEF